MTAKTMRWLFVTILALLPIVALAGENFYTSDNLNVVHTDPPHLLLYGDNQKLIFDIAPDGKVTLGPGVSSDEASKAFWDEVQQMGFRLSTKCETR